MSNKIFSFKNIIALSVTVLLSVTNTSVYSKSVSITNDNLYSQESLNTKFLEAYHSKNYQKAVNYFEKVIDKTKNLTNLKLFADALINIKNYTRAKTYLQYIEKSSKDSVLQDDARKMLKNIVFLENKNLITKTIVKPCENHNYIKWDNSIKVYLPGLTRETELKIGLEKLGDSDSYKNSVRKAFLIWSDKVPDIKFSFVSNKDNADIIVNWHQYYNNFSSWDLATPPTYYGNLNKKVSFVNIPVMINPRYTTGGDNDAFYSNNDIYAMAIHQVGHALGLKDNTDNESVMNPSSKYMSFSLIGDDPKQVELSEDDIKEIKTKYRVDSFTNDCDTPILAKKYNFKDMRKDNSDNYLCFLNGNPKIHSDGMSFLREYSRWDKTDFPLKIYIPLPPAEKYDLRDPGHFSEMVRTAFLRWAVAAPEIVKLSFDTNEKEAQVIVRWSDNFEHKNYWGLASSIPDSKNPNRKKRCYIDLAVRAQPGWYSEKPIFFGDETFINIATHEMGHALGLDHGPDVNGAGSLITDRDVNTLRKMYSVPNGYQFLCGL